MPRRANKKIPLHLTGTRAHRGPGVLVTRQIAHSMGSARRGPYVVPIHGPPVRTLEDMDLAEIRALEDLYGCPVTGEKTKQRSPARGDNTY